MLEYGLNTLTKTGRSVMVIADGDFSGMKSGGITLDLTTVPTNQTGSALTLTDDTVVPVGAAYLRFGQVMTKITATATDTVTISGAPTGGTFTVNVTAGGSTTTTSAVAYNATAATLQAALVALTNVGANNATVTGSAGGPYTIVFANSLGATSITSSGASLTGGTSPAATAAVTAPGGDVGKFGPYDPAATDGRATLTRGECFVLNRTWIDITTGLGLAQATAHPAVFDKGRVWKGRLIQSGVATHTLAAGPTLAEFNAAFPAITYSED